MNKLTVYTIGWLLHFFISNFLVSTMPQRVTFLHGVVFKCSWFLNIFHMIVKKREINPSTIFWRNYVGNREVIHTHTYIYVSRIQSRRKWFNNMETSKALWWEYHLLASSGFKGQEIWDLLFQEHNRANSCLLGGLMTPGWPLPEQCTTENILVHFATSAPDFVGLGILEMLKVGWVNTWMNKWTRCRSGAW